MKTLKRRVKRAKLENINFSRAIYLSCFVRAKPGGRTTGAQKQKRKKAER